MPDLVEQMYCSQQIGIPPNLPSILKKYAKAAIRTQPYDLLTWSSAYFRSISEGIPPPVKDRFEYPLTANESGLSPGFLKVLINQIGKRETVDKELLQNRWKGVCLNLLALEDLVQIGRFFDEIDWKKFIALAAGSIEPNLKRTMILICELMTEEPEGGSATIPVELFIELYTYLAKLDCGSTDFRLRPESEAETICPAVTAETQPIVCDCRTDGPPQVTWEQALEKEPSPDKPEADEVPIETEKDSVETTLEQSDPNEKPNEKETSEVEIKDESKHENTENPQDIKLAAEESNDGETNEVENMKEAEESKDVEVVETAEESKDVEIVETAEESKDVEVVETAEESKDVEVVQTTEESKNIEDEETTEVENVKEGEESKEVEVVETAEESKDVEIVETAEESKDAEVVERAEESKDVEVVEATEESRDVEDKETKVENLKEDEESNNVEAVQTAEESKDEETKEVENVKNPEESNDVKVAQIVEESKEVEDEETNEDTANAKIAAEEPEVKDEQTKVLESENPEETVVENVITDENAVPAEMDEKQINSQIEDSKEDNEEKVLNNESKEGSSNTLEKDEEDTKENKKDGQNDMDHQAEDVDEGKDEPKTELERIDSGFSVETLLVDKGGLFFTWPLIEEDIEEVHGEEEISEYADSSYGVQVWDDTYGSSSYEMLYAGEEKQALEEEIRMHGPEAIVLEPPEGSMIDYEEYTDEELSEDLLKKPQLEDEMENVFAPKIDSLREILDDEYVGEQDGEELDMVEQITSKGSDEHGAEEEEERETLGEIIEDNIETIIPPDIDIHHLPTPVGSEISVLVEEQPDESTGDTFDPSQKLAEKQSLVDVRVLAEEPAELEQDENEQIKTSEPYWKHLSGIGPVVPDEIIDAVVTYLRHVASYQSGMVMPKNLRHFKCPPLELIEHEEPLYIS